MPWFEFGKKPDPRRIRQDRDPRRRNQPGRENQPLKDEREQRSSRFFGPGDRRQEEKRGGCRFGNPVYTDLEASDINGRSSLIRRRADISCLTCSTRTHFTEADAREDLLSQRFSKLIDRWIAATKASCGRGTR